MPWVKLQYKSSDGRSIGHTAYCRSRQEFKKLLGRFDILPEHIEALEFDGVPYDPKKLMK